MKELFKAGTILAALFATTLIVIRISGVLTLQDIRNLIETASGMAPGYLAAIVMLLLFADLFIAIPTMTVCILAGYFLGAQLGALAASAGMLAAGICGYAISWRLGPSILLRLYKDPARLADMERIFRAQGTSVLLVCRALPILPEVSCCLAGATRMPFRRFLGAFALGTIPYAAIISYAGSVSAPQSPMPAVLTALTISGVLWLSWLRLLRREPQQTHIDSGN